MPVGVSPPLFEISLSPQGADDSFRVINTGNRPAEFELSVINWTLDEDMNIQEVEPSPETISQAILFNPTTFTVPPGQDQVVRFSIRPRTQLEPGEYRALIYVNQLPAPLEELDEEELAAQVQVVGRLGVTIYAYVGDVTRVGVLNDVRVETNAPQPTALFNIDSQGTAHVRLSGQYGLWKADAYPGAPATAPLDDVEQTETFPAGLISAGKLPNRPPVLPGLQRDVPLRLGEDLPPGDYILDLNGELTGTPIDEGIPFTWNGAPPSPAPPEASPSPTSPPTPSPDPVPGSS